VIRGDEPFWFRGARDAYLRPYVPGRSQQEIGRRFVAQVVDRWTS
jgi:hypothetical protein